jgi:hypothetical protein
MEDGFHYGDDHTLWPLRKPQSVPSTEQRHRVSLDDQAALPGLRAGAPHNYGWTPRG